MPAAHEHLARARENEALADELSREAQPAGVDWAIALLFYSSLHYIDAFLAGKHKHPRSHEERNYEVENNGTLADIYAPYRKLEDMSRAARYDIAGYGSPGYDRAKSYHHAVKSHLAKLLKL